MKRIVGLLALLMILGVLGATTVSALSHCVIAKGVKTGTNGNGNMNFCNVDESGCEYCCNYCNTFPIDTIIGNDCGCDVVVPGMIEIAPGMVISEDTAEEVVAQTGYLNWVTVGAIALAVLGICYFMTKKKR